jgi:hypothetical protein
MKKFIVFMSSIFVLFVFLMLNYLIWDKESLIQQSESDRIQQEWLRGENLTLESTIKGKDQELATLKALNLSQTTQITQIQKSSKDLEDQITEMEKLISGKESTIMLFRRQAVPQLQQDFELWMKEVSQREVDESFTYFSGVAALFGEIMTEAQYRTFIESTLLEIRFSDETGIEGEVIPVLFVMDASYENPLLLRIHTRLYISIAETDEDSQELISGTYNMLISFRLDELSGNWKIQSIELE